METKKYTTHSSFWSNIALFFLWAVGVALNVIWKAHVALIIVFSLNVVLYLVMAIKCRLAWHTYVKISEKGVKMKGCAKCVSENKKESVDDIFIPWGNVEEISGGINGPVLELKTGEKIIQTQLIYVDGRTLRKAFEQYKPKQTQENPFEVESVIGLVSDNTSPNEFTATESKE